MILPFILFITSFTSLTFTMLDDISAHQTEIAALVTLGAAGVGARYVMNACTPRLSNYTIACNDWIFPEERYAQTIYYQGMAESQTQCAKYTGRRGFMGTTGEHVICINSIDIIHTPFIGQEISEVQLHDIKQVLSWSDYLKKSILFAKCFEYFSWLSKKNNGIQVLSFPSGSKTLKCHSVDIAQINVGQRGDIANHKKKWDLCNAQCPNAPKILFGVSRGAATTFNACATYPDEYEKANLIVLEGCFDEVTHVLYQRCPRFLQYIGFDKVMEYLLEKCTAYKRDYIAPIKCVNTFPEQVPVVFITSKKDTAVSAQCTKRLVAELAQRGKNDVYLLELTNSRHPWYMMDDKQDQQLYQQYMHAIYKKYGLPHDVTYAQEGKDLIIKSMIAINHE